MGKFQSFSPSLRIMIVEDDFLQASYLAQAIRAGGDEVVGPFAEVHEALQYAGTAQASILDVQIKGDTSFDIANSLRHQSIPFLFLTGYDGTEIPLYFDREHIYQKPIKTSLILQDLHRQYSQVENPPNPSTEDILNDIFLVAKTMMPDSNSAERVVETILNQAIKDADKDLVHDMRTYLLRLLTEEFYLHAYKYLN